MLALAVPRVGQWEGGGGGSPRRSLIFWPDLGQFRFRGLSMFVPLALSSNGSGTVAVARGLETGLLGWLGALYAWGKGNEIGE